MGMRVAVGSCGRTRARCLCSSSPLTSTISICSDVRWGGSAKYTPSNATCVGFSVLSPSRTVREAYTQFVWRDRAERTEGCMTDPRILHYQTSRHIELTGVLGLGVGQ